MHSLKSLQKEIFSKTYTPPKTSGTGLPRKNLKKAKKMLEKEGWFVEDGKLKKDGNEFTFEFLIVSPSLEKIGLAFQKNLKTKKYDFLTPIDRVHSAGQTAAAAAATSGVKKYGSIISIRFGLYGR